MCNSNLRRLIISNNPDIGPAGARIIFAGLILGLFEHIEASNIGLDESSVPSLVNAIRDVGLTWRYVDLSSNNLGTFSINGIIL